jgi:hypothetical protein
MPRQTADLIALILAVVVAIVVIVTTVSLMYLAIVHPEQNNVYAADAISRIISVLVAALVGYMAGRQVHGNGNGTK